MNQLELNLTPRKGHRSSPESWRYQFAKDALVEELGNTRYVYGLWHRLFGCWHVSMETSASREIIPTWEMLQSNGIWADPIEVRFPEDDVRAEQFSEKWRFEANVAFAGFFSGIPQRFRSVVGSLGCHQWLALDLIWQCPEFARFLDQELFEDSEQYVFACFALAKAQRLPRSGRRSFARSLMHRKRREFLSELSGIRCTRATLRVLNKLGSAPHPARVYRAVLKAMNNKSAAKSLSHVDELAPAAVQALVALPEMLLTPNVVQILRREPSSAEILGELLCKESGFPLLVLGVLLDSAEPEWRRRTLGSLQRVRTFDNLLSWSERWELRLTEAVSFPSPPIETSENLAPLSSAGAMRREALEMQNCLDAMVPGVLEGSTYFYHWSGGEPATVMLERDSGIGWRFQKALGFDNQPVGRRTDLYIRSLVQSRLPGSKEPGLGRRAMASRGAKLT